MKEHRLIAFAEARLCDIVKHDLALVYSPLLAEPLPPRLRSVIERLEQGLAQRGDRH
jgi:hypothetical protein